MSRTNLQEQPNYEFHYNTTIESRDLNYAGHLGNEAVVSIIQEARIQLFKELGYSDQTINQYTSRAAEGETAIGDFEDIVERLCVAIKDGGTFENVC